MATLWEVVQDVVEWSSFPGGASGKEPFSHAGDIRDMCSIPGSGRSPGGGSDSPLQYSCLGESHGQRSLAGYSPCMLSCSVIIRLSVTRGL